MGTLGIVVTVVSVVFSMLAAIAAVWSARSANKTAYLAKIIDQRSQIPQLEVTLDGQINPEDKLAMYWVLNTGPQDLDSVTVSAPQPGDKLQYWIASDKGDLRDCADLGSLRIGDQEVFKLTVPPTGEDKSLPDFWVAFTCTAANEKPWVFTKKLARPR